MENENLLSDYIDDNVKFNSGNNPLEVFHAEDYHGKIIKGTFQGFNLFWNKGNFYIIIFGRTCRLTPDQIMTDFNLTNIMDIK